MESFECWIYLYLWAIHFWKVIIYLLEDIEKTTHPHHTSLNDSTIKDWTWRWQHFFCNFQHHQLISSSHKSCTIESIIVKHNQYGKTNDEIKKLDNSSQIEKQAKNYYLPYLKKLKINWRLSYVYPDVIFHSFIWKQLINRNLLHWSHAMTHAKMQPKYFMDVPMVMGAWWDRPDT